MAGPHMKRGTWGRNSQGKRFQVTSKLLGGVSGSPQTEDELQSELDKVRTTNKQAESEQLKQRTRNRVEKAQKQLSKIDQLIADLDKAIEEDVKISAQVFGIAAKNLGYKPNITQQAKESKPAKFKPIDELIADLDSAIKEDIKISAQIFDLTAQAINSKSKRKSLPKKS